MKRLETLLRKQLREELHKGIADSRDPLNSGLPDWVRRITTMYSPWYTGTCPECKQKFREGDQVRLCPRCKRSYHDDDQYHLYCWQEHFAAARVCTEDRYDPIAEVERPGCPYQWNGALAEKSQESQPTGNFRPGSDKLASQFLQGLEKAWKPFGEASVYQVPQGDRRVGYKCPWCRFQIRAGDRVVQCSCGECDTYFHDDVFRHLTCWNEWNGTQGNDYCPTTGARIDKKTSFHPAGR